MFDIFSILGVVSFFRQSLLLDSLSILVIQQVASPKYGIELCQKFTRVFIYGVAKWYADWRDCMSIQTSDNCEA